MILGCSIVAAVGPLLIGAFLSLLAIKTRITEIGLAWIAGISIACSLLILTVAGPHVAYPFEAPFIFTDGLTVGMGAFLLVLSLFVVLLSSGTLKQQGIDMPHEYYALLLLSILGTLVFISASHFLVLFLGLEIVSLALYPLCASSIGRARSAEGAYKYFILGAASSAIMMMGVALIFGVTGTLSLPEIRTALETMTSQLALFGMAFVIVGLAFKLALVPFHSWSPDAYLGSPMVVTAYMATVVKTAAMLVALRVIWFGFEHGVAFWANIIVALAAASIVVGNLLALTQTRLRRLFAYSGISHAGFMIIGLLASLGENSGAGAVVFYAITYPLLTLGFFAVMQTLMREQNIVDDSFESLRGLFFRSPWLACLLAFFMFGLAGLPPAIIGFLAKWYVLQIAWSTEHAWLMWIGVLSSVVGAAYYLKPISMLFKPSDEPQAEVEPSFVSQQRIVATIIFLITLLMSVFPSGLTYASDQLISVLRSAPEQSE